MDLLIANLEHARDFIFVLDSFMAFRLIFA
jgi:hypothetical protein